MLIRKNNRQRFESKFIKTDGCWEWTGNKLPKGYGYFHVCHGPKNWQKRYAHRLAFEFYKRPLLPGETIDHLCRNTSCVNPDHLDATSNGDNSRRSPFTITGANIRKTHCPQGHSYFEHGYFDAEGFRKCRPCVRARANARKRMMTAARQYMRSWTKNATLHSRLVTDDHHRKTLVA